MTRVSERGPWRYRLHGLSVLAQVPLEADPAPAGVPDVEVSLHPLSDALASESRPQVNVGQDTVELFWPQVGQLRVTGGNRIEVHPFDRSAGRLVSHLVTSLGLGLALHMRGVFTLHASGVVIAGRAVAIAGGERAGKSTFAAALARRGHEVVADDVLAVDLDTPGGATIRTGPGTLSLWPDAARAVGIEPDDLPRINELGEKRLARFGPTRGDRRIPLAAVIVLHPDATLTGGPPPRLPESEAFHDLLTHSHGMRWLRREQDQLRYSSQSAELLRSVPVLQFPLRPWSTHGDMAVTAVEGIVEGTGAISADDASRRS